jgi:hypothetical protein
LIGTSKLTQAQDQWENQEKYGRTLSRGMYYRSYEYEVEGDKLGIEKNGASSEGDHGPEGAVAPKMEWNGLGH